MKLSMIFSVICILTMTLAGCGSTHKHGPKKKKQVATQRKASKKIKTINSTLSIAHLKTNSGPPKNLMSVHFIDKNVGFGVDGYASNKKSSLLKTTDGGKTWNIIHQWNGDLSHISWSGKFGVVTDFTSKNIHLAVTKDNGATWKLMKPKLSHSQLTNSISAPACLFAHVTKNHNIWLMTSPESATTYGFKTPVWISKNLGKSFQKVKLPQSDESSGGISFHGNVALSVYNKKAKKFDVIVGNDKNGWATLGLHTKTPIYSVDYTSATQIYAGGGHFGKYGVEPAHEIWSLHPDNPKEYTVVLKQKQTKLVPEKPIIQMRINPSSSSYILTGGITMGGNLPAPGPLFISHDGGFHLKATHIVGNMFDAYKSYVWVAGNHNSLSISSDSGRTWNNMFRPTTLKVRSVQFLNKQNGFALTKFGLYQTKDGGGNWSRKPFHSGQFPHIDFMSTTHIYRWSEVKVQESNDGGITWHSIHIPKVEQIDGFSALPNGVLKMSVLPYPQKTSHKYKDDMLISKNDGKKWSRISNPFNTKNISLYFLSAETGYAYKKNASSNLTTIYKTPDGGKHWTSKFKKNITIIGKRPVSIKHSNVVIGGVITGKPQLKGIIDVTNSSLKIIRVLKTGKWLPDSISYLNPNDIWFVSVRGKLFKSTDGGKHFQQVLFHH